MKNPVLLVPGTGAITFIGKDGKDIGYPVKMKVGALSGGLLGKSADELMELLAMEHSPGQIAPVKTSLQIGMTLRPGHTLLAAYNQTPNNWNHFLYDWRADMRHSAGQLLDWIVQKKPASGRWNLVGHSQGALLIVLASKMTRCPEEFQKYVASVTLVGAPLAGTVNSARALIVGDQFGDAAAPHVVRFLRTWPSLYQMLPAWIAVRDENGVAHRDQQLTCDEAWGAYDDISADLLQRTRIAQKMLDDPLGWMMGDVEVHILMARNRHTHVRVARDAAGVFDTDSLPKQLGDTLVPHDLTRKWVGPSITPHIKTLTRAVKEHSRLFNDPSVLSEIASRIRA